MLENRICAIRTFLNTFFIFMLYIFPLWYQKYCHKKVPVVFDVQLSTHTVSLRAFSSQREHQLSLLPITKLMYDLWILTDTPVLQLQKQQYWWKYLLPSSSSQGNGTIRFWEQNLSDSSITMRSLLCVLCGESLADVCVIETFGQERL